jgi:hypothetical protein
MVAAGSVGLIVALAILVVVLAAVFVMVWRRAPRT